MCILPRAIVFLGLTRVHRESGLNISAWVCMDGVPVEVYGATTAPGKATGYIESKESAAFTVHWRDDRAPPEHDTIKYLFLDSIK